MKRHAIIISAFILITIDKAVSVVVSPCKVRNYVTQPSHGTSLRTKGQVQIIQMPPVFVQNVMIGICDAPHQNVSTGNAGEFYSCEQRYSVVEVYIAERTPPTIPESNQNQQHLQHQTPEHINFVRETVIIESGCDFTLHLLPLLAIGGHAQAVHDPKTPPPQHAVLRSPYHRTVPTMGRAGESELPSTEPNSVVESSL